MITSLTFIADIPLYKDEKPYQIKGFRNVDDSVRTNVVKITQGGIEIIDARTIQDEISIERHGFKWLSHKSNFALSAAVFEDKDDHDSHVLDYLRETMELTRNEFHAKQVMCFDWRIRRNAGNIIEQYEDQDVAHTRHFVAPPVPIVHIDFSKQGGYDRIRAHFEEEEFSEILRESPRILMVNVWRPFQEVKNAPLALCDRRSIQEDDTLEIDEVLPTHVEMEAFMKYKEHHRWYWLSNQKPEEPTMFITWDNMSKRHDGGGVSHAACMGVKADSVNTARESIEVRMMVMI